MQHKHILKKVDFILAYMWPLRRGNFWPHGHYFKLGRCPLSIYRWCTYQILSIVCLAVSVKKIVSCFPLYANVKYVTPRADQFFGPIGIIWTNLWESVIVLCFVVRYFMFILVLQSSWWGRERELIALLNLSSWCLVMVERLFLAVPRGCLQFVIVVFPDQTH